MKLWIWIQKLFKPDEETCSFCPFPLIVCPECQGRWQETVCFSCVGGRMCRRHGKYYFN